MLNKIFVCTEDEDTRIKLLSEGLIEIKKENGIYTFIVPSTINFDDKDKNIFYSQKLSI